MTTEYKGSICEKADSAFYRGNFKLCYDLYKNGGLKEIREVKKKRYIGKEILPFVESCIALSKWDDAVHGLTNYMFNRKRWINGKAYTLNPEDLKYWNREKLPLLNFLFGEICYCYAHHIEIFQQSPFMNHIIKMRGLTSEELKKEVADNFWGDALLFDDSDPYWTFRCYPAAYLDNVDAQRNLGFKYLTGVPDPHIQKHVEVVDTIKALYWLEKAATLGDAESASLAANIYLSDRKYRNYEKAYSLYKQYAKPGEFESQYGLGICYFYGYGVSKDWDAALPLLIDAEDWFVDAPYLIGTIYYNKNFNSKAIDYFNKALSRKKLNKMIRGECLRNLSACYRFGRCGLSVNIDTADKLLEEAAKYGNPDAQSVQQYFSTLNSNFDED